MRRAIKYSLQAIILVLVFFLGVLTADPVKDILGFLDDTTTTVSGAITGGQVITASGDRARASIETHFGITFPASIQDYHYARIGDDLWMHFEAPTSALSGLFGGSAFVTCNAPLTVNAYPDFDFEQLVPSDARDEINWWDVTGTSQFSGAQCRGANRTFRILADQSNLHNWGIYMEVIEN